MNDLEVASRTAAELPEFGAPAEVVDAYKCVLGHFEEMEVRTNMFDDLAPESLNIAMVPTVLRSIDVVLHALRTA